MSAKPPPLIPRKASGVRVVPVPKQPFSSSELPETNDSGQEIEANVASNPPSQLNAKREVEILNHCFDDIERFMLRLQQAAEAQTILEQRTKRSRKGKKHSQDGEDLMTMKSVPPSAEEFVDLFQKIKYSFSLLDRVKSAITEPNAPELLHHIFMPLELMVRTTCGPELGGSVVSPALTSGAVLLLQEHLTPEEKALWTELGPNWTSPCSQLGVSVPPYSPVFLDGWRPQAFDSSGFPLEDPVESQHKQEAYEQSKCAPGGGDHVEETDEVEGNGLPPPAERRYCCTYDFVARNSSELSVLQGETLQVIESSKRWWKCRNRFDQIGFVPHNILEPLSACAENPTMSPISPSSMFFPNNPSSPVGTCPTPTSPTVRPQSMVLPSTTMNGDNGDRVLIMNEELLQRMAQKRVPGSRPSLAASRSVETTFPLNYHSPPTEVGAWLVEKGFTQQTVQSLGILTGAQLFSLNKGELCEVSPEEGARVYSQMTMQKAILQDVCKVSELEKAMEKQKLKIGTMQ